MSFDWKSLVSTVAPLLGTALGGPFGGIAAKAVSTALLGRPDGSQSEIAAAAQSADPDLLLRLKQADHDFAEQMAKLGIEKEQLALKATEQEDADRASARSMQIANKDVTVDILAGVYTIGFFAVLGIIMFMPIPAATLPTVQTLLGALGSAEVTILGFYFGASRGGNSMMSKFIDSRS